MPATSSHHSVPSSVYNNNNNNNNKTSYQQTNSCYIQSQQTASNSSMKIASQETSKHASNNQTESTQVKKESLTTNKFYSTKPEPSKPVDIVNQQQNMSSTCSKSKKKPEKSANKNQLGTWQANLTTQLLLPADFTPELISQLTAEGYDVVSGTNRKARSRQQSTLVNSINSIVDSSDEEESNEKDDVYSSGKSSKQKNPNEENSSNNIRSSSKLKSENRGAAKIDSQDAIDNPSFKRFSQMLDDLIDSYEEDLQQIDKNRLNNIKSDEQDVDAEIPAEYLLSRQLCTDLVQEAFKLNSYSIMNLIRKENLTKLQNLLFYNIKDGIRSFNFNEVSKLI